MYVHPRHKMRIVIIVILVIIVINGLAAHPLLFSSPIGGSPVVNGALSTC